MLFEDRISPVRGWLLGRYHPASRSKSGLHLPGTGEIPPKLVVIKCGPDVPEYIKPGDQIVLSPYQPTKLDHGYGYEATDGTALFLYPSDQVIAVIAPEPDAVEESTVDVKH